MDILLKVSGKNFGIGVHILAFIIVFFQEQYFKDIRKLNPFF